MTDNNDDELDEMMERLQEMSDAPGSDDIIELYGQDSGFSSRERSELGSYPDLQEEKVIYTNQSG